jgi:hypothetical protein
MEQSLLKVYAFHNGSVPDKLGGMIPDSAFG